MEILLKVNMYNVTTTHQNSHPQRYLEILMSNKGPTAGIEFGTLQFHGMGCNHLANKEGTIMSLYGTVSSRSL